MGQYNTVRYGEDVILSRADTAQMYFGLFDSLTDVEKENTAKKDKIWKLPNAVDAVRETKDQGLCYWRKLVRDAIRPKPNLPTYIGDAEKNEMRRRYIEIVSHVRDMIMASDRIGEIEAEDRRVDFVDWVYARFVESSGYYRRTLTQEGTLVFDPSGINRLRNLSESAIRRKAEREGYGFSKEEKAVKEMEKRLVVIYYNGTSDEKYPKGEGAFSVGRDLKINMPGFKGTYFNISVPEEAHPGTYMVMDMSLGKAFWGFQTAQTAAEMKSKITQTFVKTNNMISEGKKADRKKKFSVTTDSITQMGGFVPMIDITGESFLTDLRFRGIEFGNYLNGSDRQASMDATYVSFMNLADLLGASPDAMSFFGKMAIAFGSRGRGSAAAHYEPGITDVINLTKMSGAGCLAHEWGHALDRHIADYLGLKSGSFASEDQFYRLPDELQMVLYGLRENTQYFKDSMEFGMVYQKSGHGYWYSRCEMFARAFDCYIHDKLKAAGIQDTYLSGHSESFVTISKGKEVFAFPRGEERTKLNAAFDELIKWCLKKGVI